jgi:hypothetical protein
VPLLHDVRGEGTAFDRAILAGARVGRFGSTPPRGYVGAADGSKPREILKTRVFESPAASQSATDDDEPDNE